jgi:two-component system response regulator NreC
LPAIEAGASGFISKNAASSDLTTGIRSVYRGDSFLSPSVARVVVQDYQQGSTTKKSNDPYDNLTDREREILKLLAEGYTTQEIADTLIISPKTVEGHRTNLMAKLSIRNRVELVKYALRKGIITI